LKEPSIMINLSCFFFKYFLQFIFFLKS
jgi:hypothetical protein